MKSNFLKRQETLLVLIKAAEAKVDQLYSITCSDIALSRALNDLDDLNIQYRDLLAEISHARKQFKEVKP